MLYELLAIARVQNQNHLHAEAKELSLTIGKLIINNRGVVREINSLGLRPLPKLMKKLGETHFQGSHFTILFDSSAAVQREILRSLKNDPRVIRASLLRVDDTKELNKSSSITSVLKSMEASGVGF